MNKTEKPEPQGEPKPEVMPEEAAEKKEEQSPEAPKRPGSTPEGRGVSGNLRQARKKLPIGPGPGNFWNNMLSTVLMLILVTALFSYLTENQTAPEELTLTEVVQQVKAGEVEKIIVRGAMLEVEYKDATKKYR
jgi:hypothetical protein